jgi:hypothetical protein
MRGNSHVRFGAGDEETCLGDGARRFIPTLPETPASLSLYEAGTPQLSSDAGTTLDFLLTGNSCDSDRNASR